MTESIQPQEQDRADFYKRVLVLQDAFVDALHLISELERLDVKVDRKPLAQLDALEELFNEISSGNGKQIVAHLKKRHQNSEAPRYVKDHARLLKDVKDETNRIAGLTSKTIISPDRTKKKMERMFKERIKDVEKGYPPIDPEFLTILPYRPVGTSTTDFMNTNPN